MHIEDGFGGAADDMSERIELDTTGNHKPLKRRDIFRVNLVQLMQRRGISSRELVRRTGIERHVVARWIRLGAEKPQADHLAQIAHVLDMADPRALFDPDLLHSASNVGVSGHHLFNRQTNPAVEQVAAEQPDLFRPFTNNDWNELFSMHGTGGPLTEEGVVQAAERINAKRALRRKFEALLETEHFDTLAALIDVMYRDCKVPG